MSHVPIQTQSNTVVRPGSAGAISFERPKLSPPYLRELPAELRANGAGYRKKDYPVVTRVALHVLWIVFRVSYSFGWRAAARATETMPHLHLLDSPGGPR